MTEITAKKVLLKNSQGEVLIPFTDAQGARNIGEIVQSTIPLTDAGLHLLDGALLDGNGSYSSFVDYIADLYASGDYDSIFATETEWQNSITEYGVCGKFVFNYQNNTVRLPKITGFVEGTINPTVLGDLTEAGLPNITGSISNDVYPQPLIETGAFYRTSLTSSSYRASAVNTATADGIQNFDASRSNSIYGNSSTVQPQTIKVLFYIVIANSAKTAIEVDIDEIATDLNGKADVDLSNMNASLSAKNEIVSWGMPDYANGISVQSANSLANAYTVPCDGFINCAYLTTSTSGLPHIDNKTIGGHNLSSSVENVSFFISKGQKFYCTGLISTQLGTMSNVFYPMKGAS